MQKMLHWELLHEKNVSAFKIKPNQTSTTKLTGTENNNAKIRLKFHVFSRGQKLDSAVLVKLKTEKMKFHACLSQTQSCNLLLIHPRLF